jgi:hypothetical protein
MDHSRIRRGFASCLRKTPGFSARIGSSAITLNFRYWIAQYVIAKLRDCQLVEQQQAGN